MQVKELRLIMVIKGQHSWVRDSLSEMLKILHKSFLKNLSVLKISTYSTICSWIFLLLNS